jgi:hypothetical protein
VNVTAEQIKEALKHLPPAHTLKGRYWRVMILPEPGTYCVYDPGYSPANFFPHHTVDFYSGSMYLKSGAQFWAWKNKWDGHPVEWDETDLDLSGMPKIEGAIFLGV